MAAPDKGPGALDGALRRALEPDAAAVDRLVRRARLPEPLDRRRGAWRLAAGGLAAVVLSLLAVSWIPRPKARDPLPGGPEPAAIRLEIRNENGFVTVTAPAGARMIILPGEPS